jgi:glycosyltransferase involved in cell wall biosynthesis
VKLSIITATYNRLSRLPALLQSVKGQDYHDFELLIVDDGSTDSTPVLFNSKLDERICYLRHDDNRGASAARRIGIKRAKGDFLLFLDSDDLLLSGALSAIADTISSTRFSYNEYRFLVVDARSGQPYNRRIPPDCSQVDYSSDLRGDFHGDYCRVVRRELFASDVIHKTGLDRGGEEIMWLRFSRKYGPAFFRSIRIVSVVKDSPDSLTKQLGSPTESGWSFMWEFERAILQEFGADMIAHARSAYTARLRKFAILSIVLSKYSSASGAARQIMRFGSLIEGSLIWTLSVMRARYLFRGYHKTKRWLVNAKPSS